VQNTAIDIWSQYRFLNPAVLGTNYWAFKNTYSIMGGYQNHKIIGYRRLDELIEKMHSCAYRVTKAECLDLPEQTFETRIVHFEPTAQRLYDKLKKTSVAELSDGRKLTASTVLTRLLRLQQLTGGFLKSDEGGKAENVSCAKLDALADIVDDIVIGEGKKLVIFARFIPELDLIAAMLKKRGVSYGLIRGDVSTEERGRTVDAFQKTANPQIILAQIDTAGLGITLTAADTAVYYSTNFNYASYAQSLARIHRIGQSNHCLYMHLVVAKSIDQHILESLSKKGDLAASIVDNWRNYLQ
jgi:SNF2 family DNA or RNA helicase